MGYNIGPKIGIDGEKEFRQQIRNINDSYKALEAETRAVVKAFDAQGDEQGKLEALSKQLNKQIEEQRKKQTLLEDAVAKASAKFGEGSLEATRLRGALYDTQATIADLENQLQDASRQLNRTENGMEQLEEATEEASAAALDFGDVLGASLVADVILDGLRELGGLVKDFAVGSIESAAEVKAAAAQYEQAFGTMKEKATESLEAISDDTNIASTRLQGSFTKIYSFAKTAGADSAQALNLSSRATVAAADSAAYYDDSIENVLERLQAFLKGNYANDAALGISATETTRNAKANELYAKSFKELTEAQKVDTLLAMVEAGNKASGAIGQAARESDSWENVMGELAEVFRLIQAEAGKPALKKLTPIIQKITKEGHELIDDIDWEAFGDTVESIADSIIDYGPGVVKAIASVAAGVVAFKASQKAIEFAQLAKNFISVGTAALEAGESIGAAAMTAMGGPWGLVASAIGLAVGAIVMAVTSISTAQSDLEKATDNLQESFQRANETYQSTKSDVEGAAGAAEYYIGRLRELEAAGLTTAAAHREYEMIVEQLNELIPDLNLQIDEQTGLITTNTEALIADVAAWKKNALAKALQDKFTAQIEAQAKAEAELIDAQAKLNSLKDKQGVLDEKLNEKLRFLSKTSKDFKAVQDKLASSEQFSAQETERLAAQYMQLQEKEESLKLEIHALNDQIAENSSQQKALTQDIAAATEVVHSYDAGVAEAAAASELYTQQLAEQTAATAGLTDEQLAVKTSVESLAAAYDDAYAAAVNSLNSQIGMFDEVAIKSDWSTSKIMKNWESQRLAFTNYSANLEKAIELGLDEELVKQLSDGSETSMQILNALVNDTGTSVDELNAAFAKTKEARKSVEESMAWIQGEFASQWDAIVAEAKKAGVDIVDGAVIGINNNGWKLANAMEALGSNAVAAYNKPLGRNSPAKEFIQGSKDIVDGAVIGIDRYEDLFADAMAGLAQSGQDAFLQKKLDVAVSYPDMVAASTVHNSRTVTNMGGFTINIAQQPGESAESLAYRCMEIIQAEVEAEGAVFGAR